MRKFGWNTIILLLPWYKGKSDFFFFWQYHGKIATLRTVSLTKYYVCENQTYTLKYGRLEYFRVPIRNKSKLLS